MQIYWLVVETISFNNSQHTLLSEGISPYVTNMRIVNCYDFLKRKFHQLIVNDILKFIWLC
jgi:hypothetical protein